MLNVSLFTFTLYSLKKLKLCINHTFLLPPGVLYSTGFAEAVTTVTAVDADGGNNAITEYAIIQQLAYGEGR